MWYCEARMFFHAPRPAPLPWSLGISASFASCRGEDPVRWCITVSWLDKAEKLTPTQAGKAQKMLEQARVLLKDLAKPAPKAAAKAAAAPAEPKAAAKKKGKA